MKFTLAVICLLTAAGANGQRTIPTTDTLKLTGTIAKDLVFSLSDLDTFDVKNLGDIGSPITRVAAKDTIQDVKGDSTDRNTESNGTRR
jgi:hypothetical protein